LIKNLILTLKFPAVDSIQQGIFQYENCILFALLTIKISNEAIVGQATKNAERELSFLSSLNILVPIKLERDYLTEFRIKKAKELFYGGNYLIHNVAGRVGYADANYFAKCFKKYYGLALSKYVKNISQ
jgi:AraC-like DNA-binding protein